MTTVASPAPTETQSRAGLYDAVIVGTSPMCMIAALAERAAGKRVLMVDGASEVGGTWKTTELLGYSNVELGCHELDAIKPVYALFESLGIPLITMDPQPFYISNEPRYFPRSLQFHNRWIRELHDLIRGRMSYDLDWTQASTLKTRFRTALRVGRQASRAIRGTNRPALYPPNGAMEIVGKLDELVRTAGIEIRLSTWLTDVEIDRAAEIVRFKLNGVEASAAVLHLTSSSNMNGVLDGEEQVELAGQPTCWQTLYLSLENCPKPPFTYLVFYNPKLLHRASDLSRYAIPGPEAAGTRLIALTIDENAPESEETAREALLQMQDLNLLDKAARLRDFAYLPYRFTRIDEWKCRELDHRLAPFVQVHVTNVLTPSINNLLKRGNFRALLEQAGTRTRNEAGVLN
jgi:hypothetical protein